MSSKTRPENNLSIQTLGARSDSLELDFAPIAKTPLFGAITDEFAIDRAGCAADGAWDGDSDWHRYA